LFKNQKIKFVIRSGLRIDVVGCSNAVRKEVGKEGKRKRIDVGCSNA
jgi:hypothetical protein